MSTLATLMNTTESSTNGMDLPSAKKRKLSEAEIAGHNEDHAMEGLDEDVIGMLRG
jgi:hypothetical protein